MGRSTILLFLLSGLLAVSCGREAPEPEAPPTPTPANITRAAPPTQVPAALRSAPHRISLRFVPSGFFEGLPEDGLVLESGAGEVLFFNLAGSDLDGGVTAHKKRLERMPGPNFLGSEEIDTAHGKGLLSRSTFDADGVPTNVICITIPHPDKESILSVCYNYSGGGREDTRRDELLSVVAQVQGL